MYILQGTKPQLRLRYEQMGVHPKKSKQDSVIGIRFFSTFFITFLSLETSEDVIYIHSSLIVACR